MEPEPCFELHSFGGIFIILRSSPTWSLGTRMVLLRSGLSVTGNAVFSSRSVSPSASSRTDGNGVELKEAKKPSGTRKGKREPFFLTLENPSLFQVSRL